VGINTIGVAYAWGRNRYGQLGDGTTTNRTTPTRVSGGHTLASISAGGYHTVGITTSGDAYAWGRNNYGQLGLAPPMTGDRLTPTRVTGGHTWASISAGRYHTVGITTDGEAGAWGRNNYGQLGVGTTTNRLTPGLVSGGHTWASISAGYYHTVGITTSADAYAWGRNDDGPLGDGTTTQRLTPTRVSGSHTWASISAGGYHTVGITTTSGAAYAWGYNGYGELGDGTTTDRLTPVLVNPRP
jgi:alpha-tubulin suppressor-like RCC1 family protein